MKSPVKAHLFVLAANIIYGINYAFGKIALHSIPPFGIVMIRVIGAVIIFSVLHRLFIREKVDKQDHIKLITASLFGVVINQLLFFKGLSLTSEIHSALIMITTPLIVLLMARMILKERITIIKSAGIISGAAGVALLIMQGGKENTGSNGLGDLYIMINAISFAIFLVIAKPLMQKYRPLTLAKWIFIYGTVGVIPFGIRDVISVHWAEVPASALWALTFVVIGATVLAYLFNMLGLHFGSPALVSIYIYTQPVIASFIAVVNGTDHLTTVKLLSALLVFAGVALVSFTGSGKPLKPAV